MIMPAARRGLALEHRLVQLGVEPFALGGLMISTPCFCKLTEALEGQLDAFEYRLRLPACIVIGGFKARLRLS